MGEVLDLAAFWEWASSHRAEFLEWKRRAPDEFEAAMQGVSDDAERRLRQEWDPREGSLDEFLEAAKRTSSS